MSDNYQGPGHYQHYKGGEYEVLGIGQREGDGVKYVVYRSLNEEHTTDRKRRGVDFVLRPLSDRDAAKAGDRDPFNDVVMVQEPQEFGIEQFKLPDSSPPPILSDEEIAARKLKPRFQKMRNITCLYFGTYGQAGHHFFINDGESVRGFYSEVVKKLPSPFDKGVDGQWTPKRDTSQGAARLLYSDKGGWTLLAFHNYIDDSRPGCNGNFFFDTHLTFGQALAEAERQFPRYMARLNAAGGIHLVDDPPKGKVPA